MDPALTEMLRAGPVEGGQEVEAILRLDRPRADLPGVRVVSRFGPIVTCRLPLSSILQVYAEEHIRSMKKPRRMGPERDPGPVGALLPSGPVATDLRRPPALPLTGRGIVIGIIDWGCDFTCDSFRRLDGSTRLLALWDQRGPARLPNRFGYGTVHTRSEIDRALASDHPFAALGYHPADADPGTGAHGTHVMDIAAGNGSGGGPEGIAPEAHLVFVHLATGATAGLANLGDSSRILEAVDFVARVAGRRPWVINLSVGSHGGPHDGRTLTEMAFDYILRARPDRFIVQSTGNYFDRQVHASGTVRQGGMHQLHFVIDRADFTPNELEVWYSGRDVLTARLETAAGVPSPWVGPGHHADIIENGHITGRIYNRACDPNNRDNHIDIFLYPGASTGRWSLSLRGDRIDIGTFHAWLERDEACSRCQTRFPVSEADGSCTTGTLANGHIPLVVGAFDAHVPGRTIAPFSSYGPTRVLVPKPDLVAPGVGVIAARSSPAGTQDGRTLFTRKSGTSMSAPHVTAVVALCLEGAGRPLYSHEIRALVLENTDPPPSREAGRYGRGYLNVERTVDAVLSPGPERRRDFAKLARYGH